jgi:hypothetical protein
VRLVRDGLALLAGLACLAFLLLVLVGGLGLCCWCLLAQEWAALAGFGLGTVALSLAGADALQAVLTWAEG